MLERKDQSWLNRFRSFVRDIPSFAILNGELPKAVIPSFIFHKVLPEEFEEELAYLKANHYRTLAIHEYYDYLTGRKRDSDKKVILTFDDGLRNNWSIAYPILKKLDMKAVFYVNPGMVHHADEVGPSLEDVWERKVSLKELEAYEIEKPFISWSEARAMETAGVINIESHGWKHRICFVGDKIIDFQRPDRLGQPLYSWLFTAVDADFDDSLWGTPVYPYEPRLVARRFFDDTGLRHACVNYVKMNGGKEFFFGKGWRPRLQKVVREYRKTCSRNEFFENLDEQELAIRKSLVDSKEMIEKEVGKKCEHFAFPWHISGQLSLLWLKELEIKTVFRFMSKWRMPRVGADPYDLSRTEGYWIRSLPGRGRQTIWDKLIRRIGYARRRR